MNQAAWASLTTKPPAPLEGRASFSEALNLLGFKKMSTFKDLGQIVGGGNRHVIEATIGAQHRTTLE